MARKFSGILFGTVAFFLFACPMFAHHGGAAFESTPITLKGTVEEFDFINPHCEIYFTVTDDSGKVAKWNGEFTNPGDRAKSGVNVMRVLKMQLPDGKELTVLGPEDY